MKRWIALMAALLMLLSLAACGTPDASEVRGEVSTNETTPTEAPTEAETTAELELGKAENNVYTNQFLGLGCKLDEDWQRAKGLRPIFPPALPLTSICRILVSCMVLYWTWKPTSSR